MDDMAKKVDKTKQRKPERKPELKGMDAARRMGIRLPPGRERSNLEKITVEYVEGESPMVTIQYRVPNGKVRSPKEIERFKLVELPREEEQEEMPMESGGLPEESE